jgi:hypothetical protein
MISFSKTETGFSPDSVIAFTYRLLIISQTRDSCGRENCAGETKILGQTGKFCDFEKEIE